MEPAPAHGSDIAGAAEIADFDPGLHKVRRNTRPSKAARDRRDRTRMVIAMQTRKLLRERNIPLHKLFNPNLQEHTPQMKRCLRKPRLLAKLAEMLDA
jgi:hypothetical protein